MGLNLTDIQNELQNSDALDDQTKAASGGNFEFKRIPMGKHPVRLVSYIEYGHQPQRAFDGKEKPDADEVSLTFEFLGKRTVEQREDGKGEWAPRKTITLKKSYHEKAGFRKLFEKLREGDSSVTHMAQLVGAKAWFVNVIWTTRDENGDEIVITPQTKAEYEERAKANPDNKAFRIWDNIRNADGYTFSPAIRETLDEDGEPTGEILPVAVREPVGDLAMFLWDDPKPMFWDSIYIDGSYTRTVDGKEVEVSKNRHQEKCIAASNFNGSPLQAFLDGLDNLPGSAAAEQPPVEDKPAAKDDKPAETTKGFADEVDEDMAELGL